MKQAIKIGLVSLCYLLLLAACGRNIRGKIMALEVGMSPEQVIRLVGQPDEKAFDGNRDEWIYYHLSPAEAWLLIFEDKALSVMRRRYPERTMPSVSGSIPPVVIDRPSYPPAYDPRERTNADWFDRLYAEVRRAPFERDKLRMISDARRGAVFSTAQAEALMKLFAFDGPRLKVLEIIAPNLLLQGDAYVLINLISFKKDEARLILDRAARERERMMRGGRGVRPMPLGGAHFEELLVSLRQTPFRTDQLKLMRSAASSASFSCEQISRLMQLYSWGSERIEVLEIFAPRIIDPQNAGLLLSLVEMSMRSRAEELLQATRPYRMGM